ncbi:hypothetical protein FJ251_03270 [bacterium]|nr:hypothetical protein [bacterium]
MRRLEPTGRLSLLFGLLVLPAVALALPGARWEPVAGGGRLLIGVPPGGGRDPVELVVALPAAGAWRAEALRIDGAEAPAAAHVELGEPGLFRRQRVGRLRFLPPASAWREAELRLVFTGSSPAASAGGELDPLLAGLVVNPEALPAAPPAAAAREADELFDGSGRWLRLDVRFAGLYRLRYTDLVSAGLSPGSSLASLRLLGSGGRPQPFRLSWPGGSWERGWQFTELPLLVKGGDSLGPATELIAYLPGADGWRDESVAGADFEATHRNPYTNWATYYLTWGGAAGARVSALAAAPQGDETALSVFPARLRREENNEYSADELHEDGWAWSYFFPGSGPASFADETSTAWPAAGEPARLRIGFDADRRGGQGGPHHLQGYLTPAGVVANPQDASHRFIDASVYLTSALAMAELEGSLPLPADLEGDGQVRFTLRLPRDPPLGLAQDFGWLLWYEFFYATRARSRASTPLELHVPTGQPRARVTASGWAHEPEVWDLTAPLAPRLLTGGLWEGDSLSLGLDTSQRRRLLFVDPATSGSYRSPERLLAVSPAPLRHDALPHMIVVAFDGKLDTGGDPGFLAAGARYADWRRAHFPLLGSGEVELVGISDVYANFGSGMQDPAALRNFLKYRYETPGSRLAYVLLLGDASTDYRNYLGREVRGDVSNALVPALSDRFRTEQATYAYTTDDYFAYMDALDDSLRLAIPDLAIGRLPAGDAAAALTMVDLAIAYERDAPAGPWRNRLLLATDDYTKNCSSIDTIDHTGQAEVLVREAIPAAIDIQKLYMCEWDCDYAGFKPAAQNTLFAALDEGVLIFNYVGHGGNDVLSDEQLLLTTRLASLSNAERRFFFVSASCNVGKYDDTQGKSMSEEMISLPQGGAIGTLASSDLSTAGFNNVLNRNFLQEVFPGGALGAGVPVGAALLRAKVRLQQLDYSQNQGANNERYAILGDPALALVTPGLDVAFDPERGDTLTVGKTLGLSGRVLREGLLAADFNGELQLSVRASADTSGFERPLYGGGTLHVDYHLAGPEIFRGRVSVRDGRFETPPCFVPGLPDSALGGYGRIRAYALAAGAAAEAVGVLDSLPVLPGLLPPAGEAPSVRLSLAGGATQATPGSAYTVAAAAASGINLVGAHPQNAIFVEFVEAELVENLTADFQYALGSASEGSVSALLPPGLPEGRNTLVASVADNLGNVGRDTLRVQVFEAGRADLVAVQPFPNPFRGRCAISFELTAPGRVSCDLYTLSGRRVRSLEMDCPAPGRYALDWDGRDGVGDEVANGTYLFRLEAIYADNAARRREVTGALVRMRE